MAEAVPPPRERRSWEAPSPFLGEDGSLILAAYEASADAYWLTFTCSGERGCQRLVDLGFRPAIARFGRTMTIRGIANRLRCSMCGGRKIVAQVTADTRGSFARDRDGPTPETRANLLPRL
ncbi:hypothetical protein [Neoroseomonas oryzicola]|uniref:Uncharacterized protein n=1 Tax=Neoroseomonas oryzicola TaxID=535904 RepID=A0A9X9WIP5_9PROT|nr:hypothetical protein [Neoroseomonas oryzicola]MBR0660205.1 hypothetical protein [Neoroseomonas oryzicola]NKE16720.1 hypothetical protein [Neoroseomonas oryzicola]